MHNIVFIPRHMYKNKVPLGNASNIKEEVALASALALKQQFISNINGNFARNRHIKNWLNIYGFQILLPTVANAMANNY